MIRVCGACKGAGLARYHPPAQRARYQGARYWYSGDPVERICRTCGGTGITGLDDVESLNRCLDVQAKLLRFAAIKTGDQHDQIGSLRAELRDLAERATELEEHAERYWRRDGAPRPWAIETHRLWRPWHEEEK